MAVGRPGVGGDHSRRLIHFRWLTRVEPRDSARSQLRSIRSGSRPDPNSLARSPPEGSGSNHPPYPQGDIESVTTRGQPPSHVVAAKERVGPGAGPSERVVGDCRRAFEHRRLVAVRLEPLVGTGPDAGATGDLALAVAAAPARPVALVLDALALRAEVGDPRERAVAAVTAVEEGDLDRLLGDVGDMAEVRPLGRPVQACRRAESARAGLEREGVDRPVGAVGKRDPACSGTRSTRRRIQP